MTARAAASVFVCLFLCAVPRPAEADRAVDLAPTTRDLRTLAREGGDHALPVRRQSSRRSIPLVFPPGAEQRWRGEGPFYLMDLRARAELAPKSGPGVLYVSGAVNGCAPIQIRIEVPKGGSPARPRWVTGGLDGPLEGVLKNDSLQVEVSEYLPTCSVKPGKGAVAWSFERFGRIRLRSLTVLQGSGVRTTRLAPPELILKPSYPVEYPERGEEFPIQFLVENVGDVPVRAVTMEISPRSTSLLAKKPRLLRLGTVEDEQEGEFVLEGRKVGTYLVDLRLRSSNANRPLGRVEVPIQPQSDGGDGSLSLGLGAIGAIAMIGVGGLYRARRRA